MPLHSQMIALGSVILLCHDSAGSSGTDLLDLYTQPSLFPKHTVKHESKAPLWPIGRDVQDVQPQQEMEM